MTRELALAPRNFMVYRTLVQLIWKYGGSGLLRGPIDDDQPEPGAAPGAEDFAHDLERLGPAFVKVGQLLSAQLDVLPPAYSKALERLQDEVEPIPYATVRQVIEEDLGRPPELLFRTFKQAPLAAASLSQVHEAVTHDGRTLAVKVQRPDARTQVRDHMDGLHHVASLVDAYYGERFGLADLLDDLRRQLEQELDFEREADNAAMLRSLLADEPRIMVPQVEDALSSRRVLALEMVDGTPLSQLKDSAGHQAQPGLAEALFRTFLDHILVHGRFHGDPHPGNVMVRSDGRLALIDLGAVERLAPRTRETLLQLVLALGNGEGDRVATLALKLGTPTRDHDSTGFQRRLSRLAMDHIGGEQRLSVGHVLLDLADICGAHGVRVPPFVASLGRTLIHLDEAARRLDPGFDAAAVMRAHKRHLVARVARDAVQLDRVVSEGIELKQLAESAPRRVDAILDAVAGGPRGLKIDAIDERTLIDGAEKIANRITYGLVIAAMFISGALLMHLDGTAPTIAAWAMLAIAFAAVGAVLLTMALSRRSF